MCSLYLGKQSFRYTRIRSTGITCAVEPISYEAFQANLRKRKRDVWSRILAAEPKERAVGKRPRSALKEDLLLRLDKARLARELLNTEKKHGD